MSEPDSLRDYSRSRAVLMGTWGYRYLPQLSAARHSLERMRDTLTGPWCGWPEEHVDLLGDESSPGELPDRLLTAFEDTMDVALFYYVGHGQIDDEDQLVLSLTGSRFEAHRRASTGLPFAAVRRALVRSPAAMKLLILDCCFSGLATRREHALGASGNQLLELTGGTGAYTMAASGAYNTAWFETDPQLPEPQTYFTRYLADLVETGLPGQPAGVRLESFFAQLRENLARNQRPVPVARSVDSARDFVFVRNAAPPEVLVDLADEVRRLGRELTAAAIRERRLRAEAEARTEELHHLRAEKREPFPGLQGRNYSSDTRLIKPNRRRTVVIANVVGMVATSALTWTMARTTAPQAIAVAQRPITASASPTPRVDHSSSLSASSSSDASRSAVASFSSPVSKPAGGSEALLGDQLFAFNGQVFHAPQAWTTRTTRLVYQQDGNLVLSCTDPKKVLWQTNTTGGRWVSPPAFIKFQVDGNLVIYGADGGVWATGTSGGADIDFDGAYAVLQDSGNFVIYSDYPFSLWDTFGHGELSASENCPATVAYGSS